MSLWLHRGSNFSKEQSKWPIGISIEQPEKCHYQGLRADNDIQDGGEVHYCSREVNVTV